MSTTIDRKPALRSGFGEPSLLERLPSAPLVAIAFAVLCGFWQLIISAGLVSEFVLPTPGDTLSALLRLLQDIVTGGSALDHLWATVQEVMLGLLLAVIFGVGIGVLIAETVLGRKVVQPFMVALYAAPKVALAPVFVAWFGFGIMPKVIMAATIAFFPIMVDTAAGLAGVDEDQDKLFKVTRASRRQRFFKLKLPTALPFMFAGLKSAAVLAVIGAIVAEFMGGSSGLGVMVQIASVSFALDRVFALIIVLSALAFLLYAAVDLIERKVVHWRDSGFIPTES